MNSKKKKNIKKIAAAATLCFALASPMVLTGCSEGELDAGTKWLSGIETPSTSNGKVGDFYLDTDDFKIYQKTAEGWQLVGSIKGEQGATGETGSNGVGIVSISKISSLNNVDTYSILFTDDTTKTFTVTNGTNGAPGEDGEDGENGADGLTPYIGENGNWWIGTGSSATDLEVKAQGEAGKSAYEIFKEENPSSTLTQEEWLESLKGEKGDQGVSVVRVESEYGFTFEGNQCVYFTIYYSNGTHETITSIIPRKAQNIHLVYGNNGTMRALATDADDNTETDLTLEVWYENAQEAEMVTVTKKMIRGIEDLSVPGEYQNVQISYAGCLLEDVTIEIEPNFEAMTLIGEYQATGMFQNMFSLSTVEVYEEGWAKLNSSYGENYDSYSAWRFIETTPSSVKPVIAAETYGMEIVLVADSTDSENKTIDMYAPTTIADKTYTGIVEVEAGQEMPTTLRLYSQGLTETVVTYSADMGGSEAVMQAIVCDVTIDGDKKYIINGDQITYLDDTTNTFTMEELIATIEGKYFSDIQEAAEYAIANDAVLTLQDDVTLAETLNIAGDLTINLNKNYIYAEEGLATLIKLTNGELTVDNGYIEVAGEAFRIDTTESTAQNPLDAKLILGEDLNVISEEDCCVFIKGASSSLDTSAYLESRGTYATIQGNGQYASRVDTIDIRGTVINTCDLAMYIPQTGTLNIHDGAYISGAVGGLYVKSGTINVYGGVIESTATAHIPYQYWNDGGHGTGDAFIIDNCGYPGGAPVVNIYTGVELRTVNESGNNAIAYYEYGGATANMIETTITVIDNSQEPEQSMQITMENAGQIGMYVEEVEPQE